MLTRLNIRDIVLIDTLNLELGAGLAALTGETGAGKSILLDATALALGARGDAGLVRNGQAQGQVTATFELPPTHKAIILAGEHGIISDGELILKRVQFADGRTRGTINDLSVSANVMRSIGEELVEIHGQHADRAMIEPEAHRRLIDIYGGNAPQCLEVKLAYKSWREAEKALKFAEDNLKKTRDDAEFLQASVKELNALKPKVGEETELATRRNKMQQSEKIASDLNDAYAIFQGPNAIVPKFTQSWRKLERRGSNAPDLVNPIVKAMGEALDHMENARAELERAIRDADYDPKELNQFEERLFSLRAASRKFGVPVEGLNALSVKLKADLDNLEKGESQIGKLHLKLSEAKNSFEGKAKVLSQLRADTAKLLDAAVQKELPPLKLERATFITQLSPQDPSADGVDMVEFWVQTNPGTKPGALFKIASGGELSRFLLALKVVLAEKGSAPTLIFDEIDAGVGGAVADAIGQRLDRLGKQVQVVCVTHAPQVAAKSHAHLLIEKQTKNEITLTNVRLLEPQERLEEIARMLSGNKVTDAAREAAKSLMGA